MSKSELETGRAVRSLPVLAVVAGVLLVGGGIGLTLNHVLPSGTAGRGVTAPAEDEIASMDADSGPAVTPELVSATAGVAPIRVVQVSTPENPFLPTRP